MQIVFDFCAKKINKWSEDTESEPFKISLRRETLWLPNIEVKAWTVMFEFFWPTLFQTQTLY